MNAATYILARVDSHLKERLVGAAVLVAAAVILIPEMLSGPAERDAEQAGVERVAGDGGVKTYTIDLGSRARSGADQAATTPPAEAIIETPAPPPETETEPATAAETTATKATAPATAAQVAETAPVVPTQVVPPVPTAPAVAAQSPTRAAPAATARTAANQNQGWAVQVGSFASQATAERLSEDLKRRGYPSFVVPFRPGAQTLYRVRIGPMQDRNEADATVQKLKREGTGATVVANG